MRTIADNWEEFKNMALRNAGETQVSEMRKAFFAGALTTFQLMNDTVEELSEEAAFAVFKGIDEELATYFGNIVEELRDIP